MTTVVIQIGNSDDKLTQAEWSTFVSDLHQTAFNRCEAVHFAGHSPGGAQWQNFCIVAVLPPSDVPCLRRTLGGLCRRYRQDSIALTAGGTEFVTQQATAD